MLPIQRQLGELRLASAIEKARADAEAAARAARGSLGTLLGIDIGSYSPPPPRPMMMMKQMAGGAQADTPINPGEETLSVEVSTRWRFISGPIAYFHVEHRF